MMEWILSACVLTAAVIGLRYALGGRINPRLQYALWALVLVRLLIPVNFGWAPFSVGNAVPTLAASTSVPADSAAEGITVPSIQTADPAPAASPEAADPAPAPTVPVSPGEEGQGLPTLSLNQGLTLLWLVGMAAVALWLAGSNLRFARQLRRSRQPVEVAGTRRPVYVTQAVESPCLFGLARPAIYLPPKILEDPEALRYAVAHETTHFRHGDPIWTLLRGVCVALHWYNPLVWWGAVLSRRDGESACDEATIRTLGEGERGGLRPHPAPPDLWETLPPLHRRHHHGRQPPGPPGADHPHRPAHPPEGRYHCRRAGAGRCRRGVHLPRQRPQQRRPHPAGV